LSNTLKFHTNYVNQYTSRHANGRIIGGAAWDLQQLLGTTTGRKLIFKALQMTPHAFNFTDFVNNVIVADDNNGTLCDQTPTPAQLSKLSMTIMESVPPSSLKP
jgi:hypothetical protein